MTATQDATIAELQRANAELRRERERGWHVRPRWPRNSLRGRRTSQAQQRIRRADRASVRDHRRAEGDVGLARRSTAGIRSDRRPGAANCATLRRRPCANSMARWSICAPRRQSDTRHICSDYAATVSRCGRRVDRSPAARSWTGRSSTSGISTPDLSCIPDARGSAGSRTSQLRSR